MFRSCIMIVIVIHALAIAAGPLPAAARQGEPPPPIEVGAGPIGEPSLRFVGRVVYGAERLQLFGYLTAGTNLGPLLFTENVSGGSAAARFTLVAEIGRLEQSNRADVRVVDGSGTLRVFLDDGGADWDNPLSFADGQPVAVFSVNVSEALQRQDPTVGVVVGDGTLLQKETGEFLLAGVAYRFGAMGIASRLRYTGALAGDPAGTGGMQSSIVGTLTVTDREARPVPLGSGAAAGS